VVLTGLRSIVHLRAMAGPVLWGQIVCCSHLGPRCLQHVRWYGLFDRFQYKCAYSHLLRVQVQRALLAVEDIQTLTRWFSPWGYFWSGHLCRGKLRHPCVYCKTLPFWSCACLQIDLRSSDEIKNGSNVPAFEGLSFCKYSRDAATKRVRTSSL
jgi:hypothetical protein